MGPSTTERNVFVLRFVRFAKEKVPRRLKPGIRLTLPVLLVYIYYLRASVVGRWGS